MDRALEVLLGRIPWSQVRSDAWEVWRWVSLVCRFDGARDGTSAMLDLAGRDLLAVLVLLEQADATTANDLVGWLEWGRERARDRILRRLDGVPLAQRALPIASPSPAAERMFELLAADVVATLGSDPAVAMIDLEALAGPREHRRAPPPGSTAPAPITAALTKWYHFAHAVDGRRLSMASDAVARCMRDYTVRPLQRFVAEFGASRHHQRALARTAGPRRDVEEMAARLEAIEWEGLSGEHLGRRLRDLAVPHDDKFLLPRGCPEALRNRLARFDRLVELDAPRDILRNELHLIHRCMAGAPPEYDRVGDGHMDMFPILLAEILALCCALDPENLGLADRYGLLLDVDRLFGDPWSSGLCLPRPLVPDELPRDAGFAERFGHRAQAGDDLGPVTVGHGAELVERGDQLLADPPQVRGCKGRIQRYARACRRRSWSGRRSCCSPPMTS